MTLTLISSVMRTLVVAASCECGILLVNISFNVLLGLCKVDDKYQNMPKYVITFCTIVLFFPHIVSFTIKVSTRVLILISDFVGSIFHHSIRSHTQKKRVLWVLSRDASICLL